MQLNKIKVIHQRALTQISVMYSFLEKNQTFTSTETTRKHQEAESQECEECWLAFHLPHALIFIALFWGMMAHDVLYSLLN